MIRAVIDANVFLSGVLNFDAGTTPPSEILHQWLAGRFEAVTSAPLSGEIERTRLTMPFFTARVERAAGRGWVDELGGRAIQSRMDTTVHGSRRILKMTCSSRPPCQGTPITS